MQSTVSKVKLKNKVAVRLRSGKAMAPHSSTPAWRIPWTEEPGRLQSMGSLRVGHDRSLFTFMHWRRKWQPISVFLPGESQGRGSLVGCRLWGRTESDTTEVTQQQQQQQQQQHRHITFLIDILLFIILLFHNVILHKNFIEAQHASFVCITILNCSIIFYRINFSSYHYYVFLYTNYMDSFSVFKYNFLRWNLI